MLDANETVKGSAARDLQDPGRSHNARDGGAAVGKKILKVWDNPVRKGATAHRVGSKPGEP